MEEESRTVKIRTKKDKIITLTISKTTDTHYIGKDKFGNDIIIPIDDINSLYPVNEI